MKALLLHASTLMLVSSLSAEPADYLHDIKPILRDRCYACHGALKQKAGLRLDTGASIRHGSKEGLIIDGNHPLESPLFLRVASTDSDERMPPEGDALTPAQIIALGEWIARGAPSPADEKPEPDPRDHWAFRPPVRPVLPSISNQQSEIRNPIDAFILAELEKRGLTPVAEARREVLLRRVYLDLTGLPPTREALHAFLADGSPDAWEKVVDQLLASPQYAERWARHWMDIWRYADWYGRRHVPDVWNSAPQVWRWRDWIVQSLDADKGYDRMIVEMLAADEVAPEDDNARVATGYLVRNWYALNPNQWMRDIVEHTGKAFLGLTFNCAHCHDHKYDPITQRDYFQFRAFFEPLQVRQDWVEGEPDPGPFQKYAYSSLRKVVKEGMVSVFDERLDAKTFIYLRGDERNFPEGKPAVDPAVPAFLRGDSSKIERIDLPPVASDPGLKPFIQQAEKKKREDALAAATNARDAAEITLCELEETAAPADKAAEKEKAGAALKKAREQLAAAQAGPPPRPKYPAQSSGRRRALATWLTSRTNPLTARVAINHLWTRHFHAPLVASVFDFGRNGSRPTHPELLDWLAVEFMDHGWSMKKMHRLIVTSETYRRATGSSSGSGAAAVDPGNRWLWRMNAGQMEAEVVRDSMLQLSGELEPTRGGAPLPNAEAETSKRRSLYFECFPEPNGQSAFAELFDAPSPMECYRRTSTIVPQQALALANSALSFERSRAAAQRLIECLGPCDEDKFIAAAYEQVLSRLPTEDELVRCREFFAKQSSARSIDAARCSFVHVLFNHNDFVTIR
jgi:hypothetical protein